MVRVGRRASLVAVAVLAAAAACSGDGESLELSGVRACDLLTKEQLADFGLDHVSSRSHSQGNSNCVWKSVIASFGGGYGLSVSLTAHRPNDFVRNKGEKTEPIAGFEAAKLGDAISIATGPDKGVVTVDPSNQVKRPIRDVAEAVMENLRQET